MQLKHGKKNLGRVISYRTKWEEIQTWNWSHIDHTHLGSAHSLDVYVRLQSQMRSWGELSDAQLLRGELHCCHLLAVVGWHDVLKQDEHCVWVVGSQQVQAGAPLKHKAERLHSQRWFLLCRCCGFWHCCRRTCSWTMFPPISVGVCSFHWTLVSPLLPSPCTILHTAMRPWLVPAANVSEIQKTYSQNVSIAARWRGEIVLKKLKKIENWVTENKTEMQKLCFTLFTLWSNYFNQLFVCMTDLAWLLQHICSKYERLQTEISYWWRLTFCCAVRDTVDHLAFLKAQTLIQR